MKLPIAIPALSLILALTGCAATGSSHGTAAGPAKAGGPGGDGSGEKGEDADAGADKIQKAERELDYAKKEAEITKLAAAAETREADQAVVEATQKRDAVKKERDQFKNAETPTKLAEKQLDVDRTAEFMEEARQELEELEGMYKKEEFANLTKELVLNRGKKKLEFSRRGLELAKKGQEELSGFDLPKKQTELEQSTERAEKALAEANARKDKTALESALKLLRAEHRVDEAQRALDKLKKKEAAKPKDAKS